MLTEWHRIAPSGAIIDTVRAPDKATAERILSGSGSVVSAISWKLDAHRWQPVRTVVTDETQRQRAREAIPLGSGLKGTAEVAHLLGITERTLRTLTARLYIVPRRVRYGARTVKGYSPAHVKRLRAALRL